MSVNQPTHGSLFAGIGGFDLGFERAGMRTVWQVEIDEYCRRVLAKHFPHAERFSDVRECGAANLKSVDVVCGGFPCQDISTAGKGVGIDGERSGLWREMRRIIFELRPRFVVVENVSALLNRGIERVLGELAEGGYDAEWDCLPAVAFGAPHRRDRVFIIAYPSSIRLPRRNRISQRQQHPRGRQTLSVAQPLRDNVANAQRGNAQERGLQPTPATETGGEAPGRLGDVGSISRGWWASEPRMGRVADGIPNRVERLHALGNAIVPQIAEWIGRRIVELEQENG